MDNYRIPAQHAPADTGDNKPNSSNNCGKAEKETGHVEDEISKRNSNVRKQTLRIEDLILPLLISFQTKKDLKSYILKPLMKLQRI